MILSQQSKNVILERLDFCPICQISLEAGPHNQQAREEHFEDHRQALKDVQKNALGNFGTVARDEVHEVFYCEVCGKTAAQWEQEKKEEHGPSCAKNALFQKTPQFCHYCGLNFWIYSLPAAAVRSHTKNCADLRCGKFSFYLFLLPKSIFVQQWLIHKNSFSPRSNRALPTTFD
jgi:hypothetical protein